MGHVGVLQGHRVICSQMERHSFWCQVGFWVTAMGSDGMVGSDGVTWSYSRVLWSGRGGGRDPRVLGPRGIRSQSDGGRQGRGSRQGRVGVWFSPGLWGHV